MCSKNTCFDVFKITLIPMTCNIRRRLSMPPAMASIEQTHRTKDSLNASDQDTFIIG